MTRPVVPLILGLGSLLIPVGFAFIDPVKDESPLFQQVGLFVGVWLAFLLAGGSLVVAGWWKRRVELEAAGYVLASTGAIIYAMTAFAVAGWRAWTSGVLIATMAGGQIGRAVAAMRGRPA